MIKLSLGVFEDIISADLVKDLNLGRAHAPDALITYWTAALKRLEDHPALKAPALNLELVRRGHGQEPITCQVLLCSRASIESMSECERPLGVHLISTPDCDPFREETPYARSYRVMVVSDRDEFLELTAGLAKDDLYPERYQDEYLEAYLNTVFHEIAHAILFAENAALNAPNDIDSLYEAGEIENDIFDCSSGYGMRPLKIDGAALWAEDMEEASDMMEAYVEDLGKHFLRFALIKDQSPAYFPAAFGVQADFERILSGAAETIKKQA